MENNAWDVAKEVKERIHDAPVLKEYITAYLTMKPEDQFFFNPFAPEPPVTARADPGPFYSL